MILYVNGDSHTAAAEAVNSFAFAEDDPKLAHLKRLPHPDNLNVSWGRILADSLKCGLHCDAESASSNDRIIRTTERWIKNNHSEIYRTLMVIQWSTWEREEWEHNGIYYQVNASGIDDVPGELQQKYKEFVANIDWHKKEHEAHEKIWQFHCYLESLQIPHVFFNGNSYFERISDKKDWGTSYVGPYDNQMTFDWLIRSQGIETVTPNSYHFGKLGHSSFARFMLQYIVKNKLVK